MKDIVKVFAMLDYANIRNIAGEYRSLLPMCGI